MQGPNRDKDELLNLMRYWLFGTFVIVSAAVTAYAATLFGNNFGYILRSIWPIWVVAALAASLVYFGYTQYLKNRE